MRRTLNHILDILPNEDKTKLILLFLLMLLAGGLEVVGLGLILLFVSAIANPSAILADSAWGPWFVYVGIENAAGLLVWGSVALLCLFLLKNAYLLVYQRIQTRFVFARFKYLAERLFAQYIYAPYVFHLQRNTAVLVRNIIHEIPVVIERVLLSLLLLGMEVIVIIAVGGFLIVMEPMVALFVLVLFGVVGYLFLYSVRQRMKRVGASSSLRRGELIRHVNEGLGGVRELSLRHREHWVLQAFSESAHAFAAAEARGEEIRRSFKPIIEVAAVSGMLLIALLLLWQGRDVASIIPTLALFAAASFKLIPSIEKLSNHIQSVHYYGHALDLIYDDMLNAAHVAEDAAHTSEPIEFSRELRFKNVHYRYPGATQEAVRGISFVIQKGQVVGLVGPTGGGKTTVADLIAGLLTPAAGKIEIDGCDMEDSVRGWQTQVGYISQTIYLADVTIRQNIAFGLPESLIDDVAVRRATTLANLDEFIATLPDGLCTRVGERGVRLSGGQRQRIGIARALYHNPSVIIMDEATSSLDIHTEEYVMQAIERLKGERTVVMIAHRLTAVKNCDQLVLIKDGVIAAQGSYAEVTAQL